MVEWPSGQWQQTVNLSTGVYHGSNPCSTTFFIADLAQPAEHIHGKDGVFGSNPKIGFKLFLCTKIIASRFNASELF